MGNRSKKRKLIFLVLMIATCALIWIFSSQSGEESENLGNVVAESIRIEQEVEWVGPSHVVLLWGLDLRKTAHVILFALLGIFASGYFNSILRVLIFGYLMAVIDELHQILVPGRTALFYDTLIDSLGCLIGILIFVALRFLILRVSKKGR